MALGLWALCGASPAAAQELFRARLSVAETVATCVDRGELSGRVDEILGRDAISEAGELTVQIDARPADSGISLLVVVSDATGVRSEREVLHGTGDCVGLVGALSVVVAMLLDDRARAAALDVTHVVPAPAAPTVVALPAPAAPTVVAPPPDVALAPPSPPAAGSTAWIALALGANLPIGLLPGVAPGVEVRGEAGPRGGPSGLFGLSVQPWAVASGAPGGEFSAFSGLVGVCTPRFTEAHPLTLAGCGTVGAGAIRAIATGVAVVLERVEPLILVGASLELALWIAPPVGLALRVGLDVPLLRPSFVVELSGERVLVHEPWPVLPVVALDVLFADPP